MMKGSSKDFSQSRDDWELAVFHDAVKFVVVLHKSNSTNGPRFERQEFEVRDFPSAVEASKAPGENGKPRLLYAVTAEGRQSCLNLASRDWMAIWIGRNQCC